MINADVITREVLGQTLPLFALHQDEALCSLIVRYSHGQDSQVDTC